MRRLKFLIFLAALCLTVPASLAHERLVLFGGGPRPAPALERLVEWAGGENARILIILWGTAEPAGNFDSLRKDLEAFHPRRVEMAPLAADMADERSRFARQLDSSTAVFFAGGDQNRIMDVVEHLALGDRLRARLRDGVVFAGTSAGTAVMSELMLTGEGDFSVIDGDKVGVRAGLGSLPGAVMDQHFLKRQRENRLFSVILKHPGFVGVGVDEGSALSVVDGDYAQVLGPSAVMSVRAASSEGGLSIRLYRYGQRFRLSSRSAESGISPSTR